ncbi:hypothetical protein SUGI_1150300 [Cryptomeria japonica]|uniref:uncharacterized protein LOC131072446 n=1 Tax=Cryptomeria japonica TaxID=3369 RepID=UPI002414B108|nr:uncharacterized protein LOC131072446 [Cryptomeria japonica]GLJ53869.1 hypothetical protein SUGI_1150300 [Cryptomeria japonica]
MHRLRMLQLVVKKKAALEPCISKIQKQKWPGEIIICTKAVPDAESLLKSSAFPNLSVLHSFANKKIQFSDSLRTAILPFLELKVRGNSSSNDNATMLCLVINCVSPRMELVIMEDDPIYKRKDDPIYRSMGDPSSKSVDDTIDNLSSTEIEKGKWIWLGVFKQCSTFLAAPIHRIVERRNDGLFGKLNRQHSEVEKGLLVTGHENNIMESFHHILKLLGD